MLVRGNKKFFTYSKLNILGLFVIFLGLTCYQGGFSDVEKESGNMVSAGQVICRWHSGQDNFVPALKADNLLAGQAITRTAQAEKIGGGELWYRLRAEFSASNSDFCRSLILQATREGEMLYEGSLADFAISWQRASNGRDNWHFQLLLPGGGAVYPGAICQPIFILECASSLVNNLPSGFIDQDELINNIQGGFELKENLENAAVPLEEISSSTASSTVENNVLPEVTSTEPKLEVLPETELSLPGSTTSEPGVE